MQHRDKWLELHYGDFEEMEGAVAVACTDGIQDNTYGTV